MNTKLELAKTRRLLADTEWALYLTEQAWLQCNNEWTAQSLSDYLLRELETLKAKNPQIKMRDMRAAFIGDGDAKPPSVV